jgi:hypothetical protein
MTIEVLAEPASVKFSEACHVCPVFIATPEFLPQHYKQRERTLRLIATAEAAGHARMVR